MTDSLKKKVNTLTKDIFQRIETLEDHVEYVKRGLRELFEEEDIKDIPSYDLLKATYNEYLVGKPEPRKKSTTQTNDNLYDPFFAPPSARKKAKAAVKRQLASGTAPLKNTATAVSSPVTGQTSRSAPSYMPDFGESLLEGMNEPKSQRTAPPKPKVNKVKAEGKVYLVEIQGVQYLRPAGDKYLYDPKTKERMGSVENAVFSIGDKTTKFESASPVQLTPVTDTEYYSTNDGKLFVRVAEEGDIFQAVGELTEEGDIGLWE